MHSTYRSLQNIVLSILLRLEEIDYPEKSDPHVFVGRWDYSVRKQVCLYCDLYGRDKNTTIIVSAKALNVVAAVYIFFQLDGFEEETF